MATAPELIAALSPDSGRPFVVDLGETTFIDSSGLTALVAAMRSGIVIAAVRNVPNNVRRTLEVTGMDTVLPIED